MKNIFTTFILLFLFNNSFCQNYQCVINNQKKFFAIDSLYPHQVLAPFTFPEPNHSPIKVMYFDSSTIIANGISHFSFNTWRYKTIPSIDNCVISNGQSWVGEKIDELSDGTTLFFNADSDTLRINTLSVLNSSWHFFNYPDGSFVKATVDSITWLHFGNISDSVKYIQLNSYDSAGMPNINSNINGILLMLSKSNGLLKTISFYSFPSSPLILNQIDSISMPTYSEVFDFNIADEFEFQNSCSQNYEYIKILGKSYSTNNDTVLYQCHFIRQSITGGLNIYNDTIIKSYPYDQTLLFQTLPEENFFSIPDSIYLNSYEMNQDSNYNYNPVYIVISGYLFEKDSTDSCYTVNTFEPEPTTIEYVKGLGIVESSDNTSLLGGGFCEDKLVWYHKGNVYWGNAPLATSISENSESTLYKLYPSPNNGNFILEINNFNAMSSGRMEIVNLLGELMYSQVVTDRITSVQLKNLSPGFYICTLYLDHYISQRQFIIN